MAYQGQPAPVFRATVSVALLAGVTMSLTAVVLLGRGSREHVMLALALVPAAALGLVVSRRFGGDISAKQLQRFVLGLGAVAAVGTISQSLPNV